MIPRASLGVFLLVSPAVAVPQASSPPVVRAAGTVLRPSGPNAVPLPNARVVLHRVGRATQGPIDSMTTGPSGRFEFRVIPDSTATYILSTRYAGIGYFSEPLPLGRVRSDTAIRLLVFDTSSTVPLATRSRTLVVSGPDPLGVRTVIDWFVVTNRGTETRVGRDSSDPTWRVALPPGAKNPQVGDARVNQVSPEAVAFRGDSMLVYAPFSPGDKELLIQYELPAEARRLEIPTAGPDSVDLFLEEPAATVAPGEWRVSSQNFEGRQFHRFTRPGRPPATLTVRFPGLGITPGTLLPFLVGAFGLLFAVGWWRLRRRARVPAVVGSLPVERAPAALAAEIAELDRRYDGLEDRVPPAEWESYRTERARLIAELDAALARRSSGA